MHTQTKDQEELYGQGDVILRSLTHETQPYNGNQITLRLIDGYTMLIESEKLTKGITVCKASVKGGSDE